MSANVVVTLSVLGIVAGVVDKFLTDEHKAALKRWDESAHARLKQVRDASFVEWMRRPRVLLALFALWFLLVTAIVFDSGGSSTAWLEMTIVAVCTVFASLSLWWLGRSSSNTIFALKAVVIAVLIAFLVRFVREFFLSNVNDDLDEILSFWAAAFYAGSIAVVLFGYLFVLVAPFLLAQAALWCLAGAELYYRFCIRNNKLATMLVFVVLGGAAGIYRLVS